METKKINKVDWWSDEARTSKNVDAPAGIVDETPVANAAPVEMPKYSTEMQNYPMQPVSTPQQMAPVIQPLVIVPYVSKDQPIHYLDKATMNVNLDAPTSKKSGGEYFYEDMYGSDKDTQTTGMDTGDEEYERKSRANGGSIAGFVFGVLYILMLFNWSKILSFLSFFTYNHMAADVTGYTVAESFVKGIIDGTFSFEWKTVLPDILLIAGMVLTVITVIVSICTCAGRMPAFFKVIAVLAFVLHLAAYLLPTVIVPLIDKTDVAISFEYYGMFVLTGLSLVIMICVLAARNKRR